MLPHPIVDIYYPSFNDYSGFVSVVAFLNECRLSCEYCFSKKIVRGLPVKNLDKELLRVLNNKYIEALVLTGGEPMLHDEWILEFLNEVDKPVKLDSTLTVGVDSSIYSKISGISIGIKPEEWLNDVAITFYEENLAHIVNSPDINFVELRVAISPENATKLSSSIKRTCSILKPIKDKCKIRLTNALYIDEDSNNSLFTPLSQTAFFGHYKFYMYLFNTYGFNDEIEGEKGCK